VIFWYLNSVEIGALLAGISLSVSPYHHEIRMRMNVLRDFFIMFFFVLLGSQMVFMNTAGFLLPIAVFSAFILVGNPLIVMVLMGGLNYTKRNSFLAGLTVAQISEFSLILIALGVRLGQLSTEILSMVTAIGLVTIFGSTYMIMYANRLYTRVSQYLGIFERKGKKIDEHIYHRRTKYDVILFGYNRLGYSLLEQVKKMKKRFLVIDFDPEIIIKLAREGNECRYGDANDAELLNDLDFSHTKMVMSTIPDVDTNMLIMDKVKKKNKKAIIIVVAHQIEDALKLYRNGAAYVVMPYFLGGQFASNLIHRNGMNLHKFLKEKAHHMKHLKTRAMLSHEHPKAEKHR
jgi:Trk K+ transport system NAD-binding subunit